MGRNSAIEWTDHTLNFWQGCRPVSEGCANCYMYRDKRRYGQDPTKVIRSKDVTFRQARKWKTPARVFVCSWSDFFIEEADDWREEAWGEIRQAPHLTWIILTKRPQNISDRLPSDWGNGWPNVYLGVTAENQQAADERIPLLLQTPAAVRFISAEPLLGAVDLTVIRVDDKTTVNSLTGGAITKTGFVEMDIELPPFMGNKLDLVIVGGESGPGARPCHPDWVRSLRDQCQASGVKFFFKQWGEWGPVDQNINWDGKRNLGTFGHYKEGDLVKCGKKQAGRLLDGRTWDEMPGR